MAAEELLGCPVGTIANSLVFEATGQVVGGVAPVGHPAPLRTLVDTAPAGYDRVWAGAGLPHTMFPTTFEELPAMTEGEALSVGA
ncbi:MULTISPECIES: YbaK/EbsC family protein [Streptomyces]|uniref:YbaK/aminoacyl-tRNA synthetase-associated domain-containing protein n=2 Tax=Streptomyces rimosus subsp. rimosus TaxID=132474 RepID=L8EEJ7_STRR1|nr:hypothetical protein [Streptomyces sp. SID5471]QDA08694.1 hypothetical protein CTZ40_38045 [Streptomyces rimosus]QGY66168.1 hypothetical protein V519_009865 [Streptomyces rimosus R6-500]QST79271.1 hypothetical protein SRIM_002975 [Streptomyces rimosus subsp. rimosus ATCC 10970]QTL90833.1 hypothetical protein FMM49_38555 [Streptomyces rimosus subsp. rimosus]